jgi:hypothetical protein
MPAFAHLRAHVFASIKAESQRISVDVMDAEPEES